MFLLCTSPQTLYKTLSYIILSYHVSSRLVSSRLVSSRLVSSRLVSSRLASPRLDSPRLASPHLIQGEQTRELSALYDSRYFSVASDWRVIDVPHGAVGEREAKLVIHSRGSEPGHAVRSAVFIRAANAQCAAPTVALDGGGSDWSSRVRTRRHRPVSVTVRVQPQRCTPSGRYHFSWEVFRADTASALPHAFARVALADIALDRSTVDLPKHTLPVGVYILQVTVSTPQSTRRRLSAFALLLATSTIVPLFCENLLPYRFTTNLCVFCMRL